MEVACSISQNSSLPLFLNSYQEKPKEIGWEKKLKKKLCVFQWLVDEDLWLQLSVRVKRADLVFLSDSLFKPSVLWSCLIHQGLLSRVCGSGTPAAAEDVSGMSILCCSLPSHNQVRLHLLGCLFHGALTPRAFPAPSPTSLYGKQLPLPWWDSKSRSIPASTAASF